MFSANDVKELREKTGAGIMDCKNALKETQGDMEKAIDWLREKGIAKAAKKESRVAAEGLSVISVDGNSAVIVEVNSETDFVAKNEQFQTFVKDLADLLVKSNVTTVEEATELEMNGVKVKDVLITLTSKIGEKLSLRRFEKVTKLDGENFGAYSHMGGKITVLTVLDGASCEIAKDVAMHIAAMNPKYIKREDVPEDVLLHEKKVIKEQAMNEGKPQDIAEKMVQGRINKFYKEICLLEQEFIKDPDMTVESFIKANNGTLKHAIRFEVGEGIEKEVSDFASEVMSQING